MDALIHFISTPPFNASTRLFRNKQAKIFFTCLILTISLLNGSAAAAPLCKQPTSPSHHVEHSKQLQQLWHENVTEPWYYDAQGQPSVLTIDENWLAVRFTSIFASGSEMPEVIRQFNQRYAEAFVDMIYNPAYPDLGLYRVKSTHRSGMINTIIENGDPAVRTLLPAFISDDNSKVLGETIRVEWKSQILPQRRLQLLQSIGAIDYSTELVDHNELIQLDPCQISTWQAANLLAEDVQVIRAIPELISVEAPIRVQFDLNSQGGVAGSALPFSLTIHFNDTVKIELGTLANLNLKPAGIFRNLFAVEYDTPLSAIDTRRSPIQLHGRLYLYASGEFELPRIPIFYRNTGSETNKVQRINTPAISVRMAALVPEAQGDYRLQIPSQLKSVVATDNHNLDDNVTLWQPLVACLILLATVAVMLQTRKQHQTSHLSQEIIVELTDLQRLQQVLDTWGPLIKIGHTLRCYLVSWAGVKGASTGGGARLFFATLQPNIEPEFHSQIEHILQWLDDSLAHDVTDEEKTDLVEQVTHLVTNLEKHRPSVATQHNSVVAHP